MVRLNTREPYGAPSPQQEITDMKFNWFMVETLVCCMIFLGLLWLAASLS